MFLTEIMPSKRTSWLVDATYYSSILLWSPADKNTWFHFINYLFLEFIQKYWRENLTLRLMNSKYLNSCLGPVMGRGPRQVCCLWRLSDKLSSAADVSSMNGKLVQNCWPRRPTNRKLDWVANNLVTVERDKGKRF